MKYVLTYESAPDFLGKIAAHAPVHRALWQEFHAEGTLLMIGPFTEGPPGTAMGIFRTRAAAEDFVARDPFVAHGVVARWTVREWNEALLP